MENSTTKRVIIIGRSGPAFSVNEVERAHKVLDQAGVPREFGGMALGLPERINWLRGQIFSTRLINDVLRAIS